MHLKQHRKLALAAARAVEEAGGEATFMDLRDHPLPLYDGDLEASAGLPLGVRPLKELFKSHHGLFIASPEYNGSFSAVLKNTLDAMRSGVMNGMHLEMVGFIEEYRMLYPELTIFLTGGDSQHFELGNKYGIFADENLTLKGLLIALLHAQTFHSSSI